MKLFVTLSRRTLAVIFAITVIVAVFILWFESVNRTYSDGSTNEIRMNYLKSLGIYANDDNAQSKEIVIPEKFGDVYTRYNKIQKAANFDLSNFKGQNATVYTYPLMNGEYLAHIIVHDGKIIGGDIASTKLNGNMYPLVRKWQNAEVSE